MPQAGGRRVRLEAVRRLSARQVLVRMWWWRPSLGELALLLAGIAVIHLVTGWSVAATAVGAVAVFVLVTLLVAVADLADQPPAHVGTRLSSAPGTARADGACDGTDRGGDWRQGGAR